MLTIEITTPDCAEGEAHIYECERDDLFKVLKGLLLVYPMYTNVTIYPCVEEVK